MLLKCRGVHMSLFSWLHQFHGNMRYFGGLNQGTIMTGLYTGYRDKYNIFTIFSQIDRVKYFWPDAVFCKCWQLVTAVDKLKDPDCANACNR